MQMAKQNNGEVYTVSQLAALAGVKRQSVLGAIHADRLPGSYKAGNIWVIPKSSGDAYIEEIKKTIE
jgi:hypothetical protein